MSESGLGLGLGPIAWIIRRLESEATAFDEKDYDGGCGLANTAGLLSVALQAAVPMWVDDLQKLRDRLEDDNLFWVNLQERGKRCADYIAEHGDVLLFRGKKKGQSAAAFNALAEGTACLAFCPGGVTLFGTKWEIKRIRVERDGTEKTLDRG